MSGQPWTFTQLGGDKKTLQLTGYSAPFGRPRKGAVVTTGTGVRSKLTYYGGTVAPDVHEFGEIKEPWQLHGRWMDSAIGKVGGAKSAEAAWRSFINDKQYVQATWGNVLSYTLFFHQLESQWESDGEVAWTLRAHAISDTTEPPPPPIAAPPKAPYDLATQMQKELAVATLAPVRPSLANILALLPTIADQLDAAVSLLNTPFATVFSVASAISDFESALSTDLVKLTGGLQEVTTSLDLVRDATESLVGQAASLQTQYRSTPSLGGDAVFSAADVTTLRAAKIDSDAAIANFLELVAELLLDVDLVNRGQATTVVVATTGDTWEAMAERSMGSIDGARALKAMNGIRGGAPPVEGRKYIVPSNANE